MLDIKVLRDNHAQIKDLLGRRGGQYPVDELLTLDDKRRELTRRTEECQKERNEKSREIGRLMKAGESAVEMQERVRSMADEMKKGETELKSLQEEIREILLVIPNVPDKSVPAGKDESDNVTIRSHGDPGKFDFRPKPHHELGEALDIIDMKRAAKISGARFSILKGAGARLERALVNFMLDLHTDEFGYQEVFPPLMVNSDTMRGTGQLPKFADDLFKIEGSDHWLIPTAEVPLTNIYSGEILDAETLPVKLVAFTPCFRAEAGSYGKDTTGLIRQHQFNKVELVKIVEPEESENELEKLTDNAEEVLRRLGLPYRVVRLCGGDLGFSASKTYDIEVWVPSQEKYREISSCSLFTDFQSRRMNMRFRKGKKPLFPHTINGSGLAVGRTMVAILENYQNIDGAITIPEVLRPYMGGMETIIV